MVKTFCALIHVAALSNAINRNVQPVYPVIPNLFSEKRKHLRTVSSDLNGKEL